MSRTGIRSRSSDATASRPRLRMTHARLPILRLLTIGSTANKRVHPEGAHSRRPSLATGPRMARGALDCSGQPGTSEHLGHQPKPRIRGIFEPTCEPGSQRPTPPSPWGANAINPHATQSSQEARPSYRIHAKGVRAYARTPIRPARRAWCKASSGARPSAPRPEERPRWPRPCHPRRPCQPRAPSR